MFSPMKEETLARRKREALSKSCEQHSRQVASMFEQWAQEPDREYASEFWGSMLRERNITFSE